MTRQDGKGRKDKGMEGKDFSLLTRIRWTDREVQGSSESRKWGLPGQGCRELVWALNRTSSRYWFWCSYLGFTVHGL